MSPSLSRQGKHTPGCALEAIRCWKNSPGRWTRESCFGELSAALRSQARPPSSCNLSAWQRAVLFPVVTGSQANASLTRGFLFGPRSRSAFTFYFPFKADETGRQGATERGRASALCPSPRKHFEGALRPKEAGRPPSLPSQQAGPALRTPSPALSSPSPRQGLPSFRKPHGVLKGLDRR